MHFRWNFGFHLNQILFLIIKNFMKIGSIRLNPFMREMNISGWKFGVLRNYWSLQRRETAANVIERDRASMNRFPNSLKYFIDIQICIKLKKICIKKYYSEHLNIEWCNLWHTSITGSNSLSFVQLKIDSNCLKNQNFMTLKVQK